MLELNDFDYYLPRELIAQYPQEERDACRLLVLERASGKIIHGTFRQIQHYLKKDDLLVLNDTKVLPCRLFGRRATGGKVEIFLLGTKHGLTFEAMLRPQRLKAGEKIIFNGGKIQAIVQAKNEISFIAPDISSIYRLGKMPLPPYIKREALDLDCLYYQTVYARESGAVAAPTAGLHFTEKLLNEISSSGINIARITLHVGPGTFKPVKSARLSDHKMESEYFRIPQDTLRLLERRKRAKKRLIAVGTTSCRALETYTHQGESEGHTDLFIYPGYKFQAIDCLLTNFHLPRTTLFMLVCAFAGEKLIKQAYQEAIELKYRFYSYGDAMLII